MSLDAGKNDYFWQLLQFEVQERRIVQVFELLTNNNFRPVLIKGWAAARKYPRPFERLSVDIDLAIEPEDFLECRAFLAEKNILGVDLHKGLRHLDTLLWENLFERTQLIEMDGIKIRILGEEDHLRVLCVHWLNDGGVNKERLWDIFYAVENRSNKFDWKRCLETVGAKRKRWIICCLGLTERYLGLDLNNTPAAGQSNQIPNWLIKTIEKEWKRDIRLIPLENCLKDTKEMFRQIKIRIPPNSIQSTVEMEGDFDAGSRFIYQWGSLFKRIMPSLKRLNRKIIGK